MSKFDENKICNLYILEVDPKRIMKIINCGRTTLYRILKKHNIQIFSVGHFHKNKIAWNNGLTKKDDRVKKYHDAGVITRIKNGSYNANSGTFEKGQTRGRYPKGKKNLKLSEVRKRLYAENKIKKLIGKENPAWKGGIYKLSRQIRLSRMYKEWRKQVLERDNYICQECAIKGIDAHHIKSFKSILKKYNIQSYEESLLCSELWDINNGKTLCKKCHGTG